LSLSDDRRWAAALITRISARGGASANAVTVAIATPAAARDKVLVQNFITSSSLDQGKLEYEENSPGEQ
jgi:hypothetical protein